MARKTYKPEEIVAKLRQGDWLVHAVQDRERTGVECIANGVVEEKANQSGHHSLGPGQSIYKS